MQQHNPLEFSKFCRWVWQILFWMFIFGLLAVNIEYYGDGEKIFEMTWQVFGAYVLTNVLVQPLMTIYRCMFLEGAFRNWQVIMMMALSNDEEATDIVYNMAVWPATKAHKVYTSWEIQLYCFTLLWLAITFVITIISLLFS